MRIKKISPTTPANGNIENTYGTSQTNAYSEEYINNAIPTKTSDLTNDSNFATTDVATTSSNGLMSASDKSLLDSLFEVPAETLSDYDTLKTGIFKMTSDASHQPLAGITAKLISLKIIDDNYRYQIVIMPYTLNIYTRYRHYSNGWKWSGWAKIDATWVA